MKLIKIVDGAYVITNVPISQGRTARVYLNETELKQLKNEINNATKSR